MDVIIDGNQDMKDSLRIEREGQVKEGHQLRDRVVAEVMDAVKNGQDFCSCLSDCIYHARCLECLAIHRGHQDHLPNCLHKVKK